MKSDRYCRPSFGNKFNIMALVLISCIPLFGYGKDIAATFDNTLYYVLNDNSLEMWIWHEANGRYTAKTSERDENGNVKIIERSGTWAIVGKELCRNQEQPILAEYCSPIEEVDLKVGEVKIIKGGLFSLTLIPGR